MKPSSPDRKVRQLDNDVTSLYKLLTTIGTTQTVHGERLDALDRKVAQLDRRITALDRKVAQLDRKVTALDHRVERMEGKLDTIVELLSP